VVKYTLRRSQTFLLKKRKLYRGTRPKTPKITTKVEIKGNLKFKRPYFSYKNTP